MLIQQRLYISLEDKKPTDIEESKWIDMKLRASSTIRLALAPETNYGVLEVNNPMILWEQLAKAYQSKSLN